jgi:hypothetical protein
LALAHARVRIAPGVLLSIKVAVLLTDIIFKVRSVHVSVTFSELTWELVAHEATNTSHVFLVAVNVTVGACRVAMALVLPHKDCFLLCQEVHVHLVVVKLVCLVPKFVKLVLHLCHLVLVIIIHSEPFMI